MKYLEPEFSSPYLKELKAFLRREKAAGKRIYPPGNQIFEALNQTPWDEVKVVILGQDPYHGAGQAHGLSFSVLPGVPIPPSLRNIYRELQEDTGIIPPAHGCLRAWASRGVLLLNDVLTVEAGRPRSHRGRGWELFTARIIELLRQKREGLVFMLWGRDAQMKGQGIDSRKHLVLKAAHPSPLAGNRFSGCRHFSATNAYLTSRGIPPIDWRL